jgi:hypothetical protein
MVVTIIILACGRLRQGITSSSSLCVESLQMALISKWGSVRPALSLVQTTTLFLTHLTFFFFFFSSHSCNHRNASILYFSYLSCSVFNQTVIWAHSPKFINITLPLSTSYIDRLCTSKSTAFNLLYWNEFAHVVLRVRQERKSKISALGRGEAPNVLEKALVWHQVVLCTGT